MGNHHSQTLELNPAVSDSPNCIEEASASKLNKVLPSRVPGQKLRLTTNGDILQKCGTLRSYRPLSCHEHHQIKPEHSNPGKAELGTAPNETFPANDGSKLANPRTASVEIAVKTKSMYMDKTKPPANNRENSNIRHRKKCKAPAPPVIGKKNLDKGVDPKVNAHLPSDCPNQPPNNFIDRNSENKRRYENIECKSDAPAETNVTRSIASDKIETYNATRSEVECKNMQFSPGPNIDSNRLPSDNNTERENVKNKNKSSRKYSEQDFEKHTDAEEKTKIFVQNNHFLQKEHNRFHFGTSSVERQTNKSNVNELSMSSRSPYSNADNIDFSDHATFIRPLEVLYAHSSPTKKMHRAFPASSTLERIPAKKLNEFMSTFERNRMKQLSRSKDALLNTSSTLGRASDKYINSTGEEKDDSSSLSMQLRPTIPRKQPSLPRFSPSAAWKDIQYLENDVIGNSSSTTHGTFQAASALHGNHDKVEKSEDSGISTDTHSSSPVQEDLSLIKQHIMEPTFATLPSKPFEVEENDWAPANDLEASSVEENCDSLEKSEWQKLSKIFPRKTMFINTDAETDSINYHSLRPDKSPREATRDIDENWTLSRSVPDCLHHLINNNSNKTNCGSNIPTPTNSHIIYLPEWRKFDDYSSLPYTAKKPINSNAVPSKPPRNSLQRHKKKFSYQSTVRLIERKKLEAKLNQVAEEEEANRRRELELIDQVEKEFEKKRRQGKANIILQRYIKAPNSGNSIDKTIRESLNNQEIFNSIHTDSDDKFMKYDSRPHSKGAHSDTYSQNALKNQKSENCIIRSGRDENVSSKKSIQSKHQFHVVENLHESYIRSNFDEKNSMSNRYVSESTDCCSSEDARGVSVSTSHVLSSNSSSGSCISCSSCSNCDGSSVISNTKTGARCKDTKNDLSYLSLPAVYDPETPTEEKGRAYVETNERARLFDGVRHWLWGRHQTREEAASTPLSLDDTHVSLSTNKSTSTTDSSRRKSGQKMNEKRKSIYRKVAEFADNVSDMSRASGTTAEPLPSHGSIDRSVSGVSPQYRHSSGYESSTNSASDGAFDEKARDEIKHCRSRRAGFMANLNIMRLGRKSPSSIYRDHQKKVESKRMQRSRSAGPSSLDVPDNPQESFIPRSFCQVFPVASPDKLAPKEKGIGTGAVLHRIPVTSAAGYQWTSHPDDRPAHRVFCSPPFPTHLPAFKPHPKYAHQQRQGGRQFVNCSPARYMQSMNQRRGYWNSTNSLHHH